MIEFGIPDNLARLVKATTENSQCQVKVQAELSYPLEVMNWLRQVDSLARLLFNLALEKVIIDSGFQTGPHYFMCPYCYLHLLIK
jgi:hypothetical protein